jgi:hypothetical protein
MYAHHEHKPAKKTGMNQSKKVGSCISVYLQCKRYDARRDYERDERKHPRFNFISGHDPSGIKYPRPWRGPSSDNRSCPLCAECQEDLQSRLMLAPAHLPRTIKSSRASKRLSVWQMNMVQR